MTNADFLNSPIPPAVRLPEAEMTGPRRFFNREMSWLAFNWRVVEEACNINVPLLERLRFLSISATNLDEFYTVRVAGLRELARSGNAMSASEGYTPAQQLTLINEDARKLLQTQQTVWNGLKRDMARTGISIPTRARLTRRDQAVLEDHFLNKVFPVLSPLAIDPAHPFPFIPNTGFCLALELERISDQRALRALLPIPQQVARFIALPAKPGESRFMVLEDLLLLHLGALFPGYRAIGHCAFRVLRDARKPEIKKAVEDLFKVKVLRVNTMNVRGKQRRQSTKAAGKTSDWKKAIITLKEGEKIELQ